MAETKFTPGPWEACGGPEKLCSCFTVGSPHHPIAQVTHGEWGDEYCNIRLVADPKGVGQIAEAFMDHCWYGEVPIEQAQANARLIAAAPEMYEALKGVVGDVDCIGPNATPEWKAAVAALRKAVQS